jgi:hypothetical protein
VTGARFPSSPLSPQPLDVLPSFTSVRRPLAEADSKTTDPSVRDAADKLLSNRNATAAAGIRWFSYHLQSTLRSCLSPSFRASPPSVTCTFDPRTSVHRYQANALDLSPSSHHSSPSVCYSLPATPTERHPPTAIDGTLSTHHHRVIGRLRVEIHRFVLREDVPENTNCVALKGTVSETQLRRRDRRAQSRDLRAARCPDEVAGKRDGANAGCQRRAEEGHIELEESIGRRNRSGFELERCRIRNAPLIALLNDVGAVDEADNRQ